MNVLASNSYSTIPALLVTINDFGGLWFWCVATMSEKQLITKTIYTCTCKLINSASAVQPAGQYFNNLPANTTMEFLPGNHTHTS